MRAVRFRTAVVVVLAATVLFACSSDDDSGSGGNDTTSTTGATSSTAGTGGGGGEPGCDLVSANDVGTALGLQLGEPTVTENAPVTVCTYSGGTGETVIVRYQTGEDADAFERMRAGFDETDQPTTDLDGLGDMAFTSTVSMGSITTNTVVTNQDGIDVLITGPASLPQIEALARTILDRL